MKKTLLLIAFTVMLLPALLSKAGVQTSTCSAQCAYKNNAFSKNEYIAYNLYFNWKFVWVKAGTATMYTVPSVYQGQSVFRTSLITKSSDAVDKVFMMRDTILTYFTDQMVPVYYRKGAREGKRYYVDEMWYTYKNNMVTTNIKHLTARGNIEKDKKEYEHCVYDMLNAFQRIRNYDATKWKVGHVEYVNIAGGSELVNAKLVYKGKEKVKADNNKTYDCLILSYVEKEDGKDHEIVRFYVTNDKRHIPVRLDMFLKFGSAKAFLSNMK